MNKELGAGLCIVGGQELETLHPVLQLVLRKELSSPSALNTVHTGTAAAREVCVGFESEPELSLEISFLCVFSIYISLKKF